MKRNWDTVDWNGHDPTPVLILMSSIPNGIRAGVQMGELYGLMATRSIGRRAVDK